MQRVLAKSLPFAVLLAAAVYLFTRTLQFDFPRTPGRLGPDVWPQLILVLLMLACAAGIGRALILERCQAPEAEPGDGSRSPYANDAELAGPEAPSRYGLVVGGLALFLAYPLALDYLGFLVATFLLMVLFMWVGQWRSIPGIVAVSALGTFALFYIFRGVVYVSLPLGSGPFHDVTVWIASLLGMR